MLLLSSSLYLLQLSKVCPLNALSFLLPGARPQAILVCAHRRGLCPKVSSYRSIYGALSPPLLLTCLLHV